MSDPMGKALLAHKMQVMYNLCSRFTNVRLAGEVAPGDATIAVIAESPADIDAFHPRACWPSRVSASPMRRTPEMPLPGACGVPAGRSRAIIPPACSSATRKPSSRTFSR